MFNILLKNILLLIMITNMPYNLLRDFKFINFYRYKSCVLDRLYQISTWREDEREKYANEIQHFEKIKETLLSKNKDIHWDNKVVIECLTNSGGKFFIGCFDDMWSIGLSVSHDKWIEPFKLTGDFSV